jgi:DNA-directed RNA polymerase specialized sigma24 family protein
MTTKDYLNQINRLNMLINNKLLEISQYRELSCSISAVKNEEKVMTSPNQDKIGTNIAKIDEMERKLDEIIDNYIALKEKIKQQINKLPKEKHKIILYEKYIKFKSISEISKKMDMTDRGCKKAHKKALEEFEKINKIQYTV